MPIRITDKKISELQCDVSVDQVNGDGPAFDELRAAAGAKYRTACEKHASMSIGSISFVQGFSLKSKYIARIAAPVWRGGMFGEWELLASCYVSVLDAARDRRCKSIAFPLLSSGSLGFPAEGLMNTAMKAIGTYLNEHDMDVYVSVPVKTEYSMPSHMMSDLEGYISKARESEAALRATFALSDKGLRAHSYAQTDNALFLTNPGAEHTPPEAKSIDTPRGLTDMLKDLDRGFADTLFYYIDKKGISDVECYKRANVDKKTFSKIKCNRAYKPSKITAVSFAIALRLNLDETDHLLNTVGMSLSRSSVFDVIIEYFITTGDYETIHDVNQTLFQFDQVLLGC